MHEHNGHCASSKFYLVAHLVEINCGVDTISRLLKIMGLFCKEPYKRDDILQKRPIILKSLLIVAAPHLVETN